MSNDALKLMEYDAAIRQVMIDGQPHFSVIDVFKHYGSGSTKPRQEWERAKAQLIEQGFDVGTKMSQHQFEGQGQRLTPVATFENFLRIAMIAPFKNWENLREYMVQATREKIAATLIPNDVPLLPLSRMLIHNVFQTKLGHHQILIRQHQASSPPFSWFHWYLAFTNCLMVFPAGEVNHAMILREGTDDNYEPARTRALEVLNYYHDHSS